MNFSASIPVALMEAANAHLEGLGFGFGNFSVPASADGQYATHAGLHCWPNAAFRAALAAMVASGNYPGLVVTDGTGEPNFAAHCTAQALEWVQQAETWTETPIMTGDQRTYEGKTWASLLDFNVWAPPVGWREVVSQGYPAWVQPTGAHDAYKVGDRVSFEGANYESTMNGNVWSPTAFPQAWTML